LQSGAPVEATYGGPRAKCWKVKTGGDLTFEGTSGGSEGTFPAGSGTQEIGTLRAARPGQHQFYYESEDLASDPADDARLETSDGPTCPGDAASEIAGGWS